MANTQYIKKTINITMLLKIIDVIEFNSINNIYLDNSNCINQKKRNRLSDCSTNDTYFRYHPEINND